MDKRTEQAFAYLEKNEHSMMELLKNLVSIETPSADREANERIAAHLDTYCDALGMASRRISRLALRSVIPISAASCAEVIT